MPLFNAFNRDYLSSPEVAGILDFGDFSIVVQLIRRQTTTEHRKSRIPCSSVYRGNLVVCDLVGLT